MKKILIVDDEPRITKSFEAAFNHDYEILCAHDGESGIRLIRQSKPDLVVLDWRLKGHIEGKEVFLFSKKELPQVPVYVVTASIQSVKEIEAMGVDGCFLKPYADLLEKIKSVLPPGN